MEDDSFPAKRRNLLLISFLLVFIKYADADIGSAASLSVLKFNLKRPEALIHSLWVLWGYFFVRAYQHYSYYLSKEYKRSIQKIIVPIYYPCLSGMGVPEEGDKFFFDDYERFHRLELDFRLRFIFEFPFIFYDELRLIVRRNFGKRKRKRGRIKAYEIRRFNLLDGAPFRYFIKRTSVTAVYGYPWKITVWTPTDRSFVGAGKMPVEVVGGVGLGFLPAYFYFIGLNSI